MYSWTIFDLMERLIGSEYARSQVELATGQAITDLDGDGMPDSQAQIRAAFDYIVKREILLDESTPSFTPTQVQGSLFHDPAGRAPTLSRCWLACPVPGSKLPCPVYSRPLSPTWSFSRMYPQSLRQD